MSALITKPAASVILAFIESNGATLTEIAHATGRPVSTVQRAIEGLVSSGAIVRDGPRGRLHLAPDAPVRALGDIAKWQVGPVEARQIHDAVTKAGSKVSPGAPSTIRNEQIRAVWSDAISSIVTTYDPARVILFGSQARGDPTPDSDVDLLVVFDDDESNRRERRIGIRRLLGGMPFAKDVLVASTSDLEKHSGGTAVAAALRDGVVVYER